MICDFGCARMEQATQSLAAPSSAEKGTWNYLAPELLQPGAERMSKETDVWAFGMTIYVRSSSWADISSRHAVIRHYQLVKFHIKVLPNLELR